MPITASLRLEVWLTTPKFPAADPQGCNTLADHERTAKTEFCVSLLPHHGHAEFCSPDITEMTPFIRPWDWD